MVDFYIVLCNYIIVISPQISSAACELYVGHMLFSGQAFQLQVTFVLCADHPCENCVKAEQKKAKLNNQSWLKEHEAFWKKVSLLFVEPL